MRLIDPLLLTWKGWLVKIMFVFVKDEETRMLEIKKEKKKRMIDD